MGADCIVEIGDPVALEQSFAAIRLGGVISVVGILGRQGKTQPSFLEITWMRCAGVLIGNRSQFEEMNSVH